MTDDLYELRAVLRERAALAPNADDLIPATRRLARRRQIRRRGAVLGCVIVATALALVGATLLGRADKPVMPAGDPLVPPVFSFSVGPLPAGLVPASWTSTGSDLTDKPFASDSMTFTGPHDRLTVQRVDYNPVLVDQGAVMAVGSTFTVHGVTSTVKQGNPIGHYWDVSWQVGPTAWMDAIATGDDNGKVDQQAMVTIADAITTTPSNPLTSLTIPHLPAGFTAFTWQHNVPPGLVGAALDEVELCPPLRQPTGEQACFQVIVGRGTVADATTAFGPAIATYGRQIDSDHWVGVSPAQIAGIDPAEIKGLLRETSIG